jgi:hypothetical protein
VNIQFAKHLYWRGCLFSNLFLATLSKIILL